MYNFFNVTRLLGSYFHHHRHHHHAPQQITSQLIKVKEHHPAAAGPEYERHMQLLAAGAPTGALYGSDARKLLGGSDGAASDASDGATTAGSAIVPRGLGVSEATPYSAAALAVTEVHGATPSYDRLGSAYDGSEEATDLFEGMHPPPPLVRDAEELLAFAHALLNGEVKTDGSGGASSLAAVGGIRGAGGAMGAALAGKAAAAKRTISAVAALASLPLHLLSSSSLVSADPYLGKGDAEGALPSLHGRGESTVSTADRLRAAAEALLASLADLDDNGDADAEAALKIETVSPFLLLGVAGGA